MNISEKDFQTLTDFVKSYAHRIDRLESNSNINRDFLTSLSQKAKNDYETICKIESSVNSLKAQMNSIKIRARHSEIHEKVIADLIDSIGTLAVFARTLDMYLNVDCNDKSTIYHLAEQHEKKCSDLMLLSQKE